MLNMSALSCGIVTPISGAIGGMVGARAGQAPIWGVIAFALLGFGMGVGAGACLHSLADSALNSKRVFRYMTICMLSWIIVQFATAGITLGLARLLF